MRSVEFDNNKKLRDDIKRVYDEIKNNPFYFKTEIPREKWEWSKTGGQIVPNTDYKKFEKKFGKSAFEYYSELSIPELYLAIQMLHGLDYGRDLVNSEAQEWHIENNLECFITSEGFDEDKLIKVTEEFERLREKYNIGKK